MLAAAVAAAAPAAGAPHGASKSSPRKRRLQRQIQRSKELERQKQHRQHHRQQQPQPQLLPAEGGPSDSLRCPHFAACSGCTLEAGLSQPPIMEVATQFFREACGFPSFRLTAGSPQQWRQRARLAVRQQGGRVVIGLFEEGSHNPISIPSCVVHHPAINEAVQLVQRAVAACSIQPYDEGTGTGQLRYAQLTVVHDTAQAPSSDAGTSGSSSSNSHEGSASMTPLPTVQLALVWNTAAADDSLVALADWLWEAGQQQAKGRRLLHSVWANFQPERSNTILGASWQLMHGSELAWARLGGADVCFGPGSFMQANFAAMDRCLAAMQEHVPAGSTVADLHAGVGTIGLSLAASRQPRWVRFVEINGQGLPPFQHSKARLLQQLAAGTPAAAETGIAGGSSSSGASSSSWEQASPWAVPLEYHVAAAGSDPDRWCQGAQVVVLDPPRKGLEPSLLRWLCSPAAQGGGVHRLLYLSCGFPAFQRDCRQLLGSGRWTLASAEAFLFFPGTDHIETLAVFDAV